MNVALKHVERLAAVLEQRGEGTAAEMVQELIRFTDLKAKFSRDMPRKKGPHRKKSCTGKMQLNEAQAMQLAMELNQGLSSWMTHYSSYPCLYCGHWHAGSDDPENRRYLVDEPMTDMEQIYERVWLEVQKPEWMVEKRSDHYSALGSMLMLLAEEFGWEIPERPGRAQKLIDRFKAEFVDTEGESDAEEDVAA
jgi:hypothetical protein